MKWSLPLSVVVLLLFAMSGVAQDQTTQDIAKPYIERYKFDFSGGGARAEGMGKAFIAISDDITAGSWNPSGLYILEKPIASISYGSFIPRGSSSSTLYGNLFELDHDGSYKEITALNFIAPVRIKGHHFVGSFNYTRNFDDYSSFGYTATNAGDIIINNITTYHFTSDGTYTTTFHSGLNSINFGFGTRVYKNLAFGASVNIYTGLSTREQNNLVMTDYIPVRADLVQGLRTMTTTTVIDTNKFSGYNVTLGFKLNGDQLDAGLVIRTPFSLNVKTGRSIYVISKSAGLETGDFLTTETDTTYYDNLLVKYYMPLMIGGGVSYQASENLLVATEMEYRPFASKQVDVRDSLKIDPGGNNIEFFTRVDPEWNNVLIVRAGGEFLKETEYGIVPLRAGFGIAPIPAPNIDLTGAKTSSSGFYFSFGSGIHWEQIHLDWAYTYSSYKTTVGNIEDNSNNHHFNFTFTGYF